MKLVGSKTSPYVRKIRVMLAEKNLPCEFIEDNAWHAATTVPRYNPLNKVPALVLEDGESVYDSSVITEYLDSLGPSPWLPRDPAARAKARRDEALGNGIADAGVRMFLERKRVAAQQDPTWIARQRDKVEAGIAAWSKIVAARGAGAPLGLGDIACGCALLWLEFRLQEFKWRDDPVLARWIQPLETRPSFALTKPG